MKKLFPFICSAALCVSLTACSNPTNRTGDSTDKPSAAVTTNTETTTESVEETTEPPSKTTTPDSGSAPNGGVSSDEKTAMRNAFADALEKLIENHTLPDGTDLGFNEGDDMANNQFSVFDIDQDGKEELIIMYGTTYSAGMVGTVLAYDGDTGKLKTELLEYPLLTFYDNGAVQAEWSHNQGLGGNFWPYTVYQYDSATDTYVSVGSVDAWDNNFAETDSQGNPYPSEVDNSDIGFVYYIRTAGQTDTPEPVDLIDFKEWFNTYIGVAGIIDIPYMDLKEDNISLIRDAS